MQKKFNNEKGQVLIFVTLAFVLLGMFIGLAVDGGRAYLMRERLRSVVDAAALAGAKAMAGPADPAEAQEAARKAACDSALVNGVDAGDCSSGKFTVAVSLNPERKVTVTGSAQARTFFMALGGFIGCESCKRIDLQHVGTAVPDTLADVVLVLDDTGTMSSGCNTAQDNVDCPIRAAKQGAHDLIGMLFGDAQSHAKIAYVPFRGCYSPPGSSDRLLPDLIRQNYQNQGFSSTEIGRRGCILRSEMMDLTEPADQDVLKAQIDTRHGSPGFPGTNICLALIEGRAKLFGNGQRAIARKIMVILSDGAQNYSDSADGPQPGANPPLPNLGFPIPTPYPKQAYLPNVGDAGVDSNPSCMSNTTPGPLPGAPNVRWPDNFNQAIAELDTKANNYASTIKNADTSGTNVEIYFLRFANPPGDTLTTGVPSAPACDPSLVGNVGSPAVIRFGSNNTYNPDLTNDFRDRNLSRCLASNTAMGDPRSNSANDHYFYAATAGDITAKFQQIASNILQKRRLVS